MAEPLEALLWVRRRYWTDCVIMRDIKMMTPGIKIIQLHIHLLSEPRESCESSDQEMQEAARRKITALNSGLGGSEGRQVFLM